MGLHKRYPTVKSMQKAIDKYVKSCGWDKRRKYYMPMTITGLALALGFNSRTGLIRYDKIPEYKEILKMARLRIENDLEVGMLTGTLSTTGCIFNLKTNYKWDTEENSFEDININIKHVKE